MRFLVSAMIFLLLVIPTTVANATTLTEILPGIGSQDLFGVFGGHVTISSSGAIDVELKFNFPGNDLNGAFDPAERITWMPGDLLFYSGSHLYGIPIVNHSLAPVGNSGVFPSVTAFDVYRTDAFQTADQLLVNTSISHRTGPTAVVWLGDSPVLLGGPLTHTITNTGDSSIGRFRVDISGQLPTDFVNDVNANGFTVFFASTQCANGYLTGGNPPVPEPASLVLFATGLLGMGGLIHHRISKK